MLRGCCPLGVNNIYTSSATIHYARITVVAAAMNLVSFYSTADRRCSRPVAFIGRLRQQLPPLPPVTLGPYSGRLRTEEVVDFVTLRFRVAVLWMLQTGKLLIKPDLSLISCIGDIRGLIEMQSSAFFFL